MPKTPPTPLERALRLLRARARTAMELDRALARAGVERSERASALARLRELGYMDDAAVAGGRARTLLGKGLAPRMAERRLRSQGVQQGVARQAVEGAAEGQGDRALVEKALERRLRGRPVRDENERRRLFRSLVAKGHRPAVVAQVLKVSDEVSDEVESGDEVD